ncbi:hypothetical protein PVAND_002198 [Polypedilum vanderplanki]|uniref:Oxysterol-binding protein n=1 Tax=Polypedilum vanderplanki TaxID=319348 RepID=A0A9J6BQ97_POLVA|nr:hypothetical protein PVAND_002198 [Polypedilum vanderplanki]
MTTKAIDYNKKKNDKKNADHVNGNVVGTNRRTRIPDKPNHSISLWGILKNCIGKDLTKIPLPVHFNEPISMLQRGAEDFEYSELLDKAAQCKDIGDQLSFIAAFSLATYSTCSERVAKPFNPLLGETYEFDRTDDMGWKLISEQVSHHPPILAQYTESKHGWRISQQLQMDSKFRGKHISAIPTAFSRIDFDTNGASYVFNRPNFAVYNIIFGKMYVDIVGDVKIIGHKKAEGWQATLTYIPQTFFSKQPQRIIKGQVIDPSNNVKLVLNGRWNEFMEMARVISFYDNDKYETNEPIEIWKKRLPPSDSHKYYNFTIFACQLNEIENNVAPSDSRNRPDQRLMEDGLWEESNKEKFRLEEIQRERRKQGKDVVPAWFKKQPDEYSETPVWKFAGEYWNAKEKHDWKRCPKLW